MFFNQDILFRNGPLSLVWMAGNDEFKFRKGRRNKEFIKVLRANIATICQDLRDLFPAMGTAHGPGLKKMGTLLKGVGVIYSLKLDAFARDVYEAIKRNKKPPPIIPGASIDAQAAGITKKTKAAHAKHVDRADNVSLLEDEFGGLQENRINEANFGALEFDQDVLGTPRALPSRLSKHPEGRRIALALTPPRDLRDNEQHEYQSARKRPRREEESEEAVYRDLLSRLQVQDPNAYCLPEADNAALPRHSETFQAEFDFGGDADILAFGNGLDAEANGELPSRSNAAGEMPSLFEDPSAAGPPSRLEFDNQPEMRTPPRAQTQPENTRQHRGENGDAGDLEGTVMKLGELEAGLSAKRREKGKRRLMLRVDEETKYSLRQMTEWMKTVKQNDKLNLQRKLADNRALPKSYWKYHIEDFESVLLSSGRVCKSRALNGMIRNIIEGQLERQEVINLDVSRERQRQEQSSNLNGISISAVNAGRSIQGIEPEQQQQDDFVFVEPPPTSDVSHAYDRRSRENEGEIEVPVLQPEQEPQPEMVNDAISLSGVVPPPKKKSKRVSKNAEQSKLANQLEGTNTFSDLYPPNRTSKKRAAMAFFALLKMQAQKEVFLVQEEPYGPIVIEKLNKV